MVVSDDYLQSLQALLPHGPAWPRDPDATVTKLLSGISDEMARVGVRAEKLTSESSPITVQETLAEWERVAGLSAFSAIDGTSLSFDQRMSNLNAAITERGGYTVAYFIGIAAALGFAITITEYKAWTINDDVESIMYGNDWNFAWKINASSNTTGGWSVESDVEAPFAIIWLNSLLEAAMHKDKPAHTVLIFNYA